MVPAAPSGAREVRARSNGDLTALMQLGAALARGSLAHLHANELGASTLEPMRPRPAASDGRRPQTGPPMVQHVSVTC